MSLRVRRSGLGDAAEIATIPVETRRIGYPGLLPER